MPLPERNLGEARDTFIQRCMKDEVMKSEYPDARQRIAVCAAQASK
jgi:hypothetical protein